MAIKQAAAKDQKVIALFSEKDKKESEKKWGKAVMSHGYCIYLSISEQF